MPSIAVLTATVVALIAALAAAAASAWAAPADIVLLNELLDSMAAGSAPIAARAASCGYWDLYSWLHKVGRIEIRLKVPGLAEQFTNRFNSELATREGEAWRLPDRLVYHYALEWLDMWDQVERELRSRGYGA